MIPATNEKQLSERELSNIRHDMLCDLGEYVEGDTQPQRALHNYFLDMVNYFNLPHDFYYEPKHEYSKTFVIDTMKQFIKTYNESKDI